VQLPGKGILLKFPGSNEDTTCVNEVAVLSSSVVSSLFIMNAFRNHAMNTAVAGKRNFIGQYFSIKSEIFQKIYEQARLYHSTYAFYTKDPVAIFQVEIGLVM